MLLAVSSRVSVSVSLSYREPPHSCHLFLGKLASAECNLQLSLSSSMSLSFVTGWLQQFLAPWPHMALYRSHVGSGVGVWGNKGPLYLLLLWKKIFHRMPSNISSPFYRSILGDMTSQWKRGWESKWIIFLKLYLEILTQVGRMVSNWKIISLIEFSNFCAHVPLKFFWKMVTVTAIAQC